MRSLLFNDDRAYLETRRVSGRLEDPAGKWARAFNSGIEQAGISPVAAVDSIEGLSLYIGIMGGCLLS